VRTFCDVGASDAPHPCGLRACKALSEAGRRAQQLSLDEALMVANHGQNLVAVNDALEALAGVDARKSQVRGDALDAAARLITSARPIVHRRAHQARITSSRC
jgi:hypothetical protein